MGFCFNVFIMEIFEKVFDVVKVLDDKIVGGEVCLFEGILFGIKDLFCM